MRLHDLTGMEFGRWTVIGPHKSTPTGTVWKCRCECGNEKFVQRSVLKSGESRSCGCLKRELAVKRFTTHGGVGTPEYRSWQRMKQRVSGTNGCRADDWHGRGISCCARWIESFQEFLDDMGSMPEPGCSVERIDNDGDYGPENCRWATPKEQARNTRRNRLITCNGETMTLVEWSERTGLGRRTIAARLDRGWSVADALQTPVKK